MEDDDRLRVLADQAPRRRAGRLTRSTRSRTASGRPSRLGAGCCGDSAYRGYPGIAASTWSSLLDGLGVPISEVEPPGEVEPDLSLGGVRGPHPAGQVVVVVGAEAGEGAIRRRVDGEPERAGRGHPPAARRGRIGDEVGLRHVELAEPRPREGPRPIGLRAGPGRGLQGLGWPALRPAGENRPSRGKRRVGGAGPDSSADGRRVLLQVTDGLVPVGQPAGDDRRPIARPEAPGRRSRADR